MCFVRFIFCEVEYPQRSHLKSFILSCTAFWCLLRSPTLEVEYEHLSHSNLPSPPWYLPIWLFKSFSMPMCKDTHCICRLESFYVQHLHEFVSNACGWSQMYSLDTWNSGYFHELNQHVFLGIASSLMQMDTSHTETFFLPSPYLLQLFVCF